MKSEQVSTKSPLPKGLTLDRRPQALIGARAHTIAMSPVHLLPPKHGIDQPVCPTLGAKRALQLI